MAFGVIEGMGWQVLDPRFRACFPYHARVERLWTGARWAEGPAWFAAGRYLVFSDIPNDRIMRWDETDGSISVFRQPAMHANGNTVDREGRLVTAEHRGRRVTRTEWDGSVTVVAESWSGKRLNSPNDVVVKSDGSIWFTDPEYGIRNDYEGDAGRSEIGACHVYRADPASGAVAIVADDFVQPNGLAFSPDERFLYVSDTGISHVDGGPRHIRRLDVRANGRGLGQSTIFAECAKGAFDGFRCDSTGRIWASAGDGVHVFDPSGDFIGKLLMPETVANLTFGGPKRNRLFICGTTSLYSAFTLVTGARLG